VNGDGYDDLVIGAYGADPNGLARAGASYVVFGSNFNGAVSHPGSAQADSLLGGAGADRLLAMRGNDTLAGRGGADVLHGGPGVDVADYTASPQAVQVDLSSGLGLGGDAQGDQLSAIENLWGSAGNDTLSGDALANALDGGTGNDTLLGRAGSDNLSGGAGFDRLEGGAGDDTLRGAENADTLLGGDGNDLLGGGKGVDSLDGGAGDDTLSGAAGADILIGGDGLDLVDYSAATDAVVVDLTIVGVPQLISALQSSDSLSGIERVRGSNLADSLTGDATNNQLFGLPGHDTLVGNEGFDTLDGGDGNDLLVGGANADMLLGGAGNDTLGGGKGVDTMNGGDGDDWLTGALGSDLLTGGAGADRFVFNATVNGTNNIDTLTDFESGFDQIHLGASVFTALAPQTGQQLGIGNHLLYDNATGILSYDADGAGPGAPLAFAILGVGSHPDTLGNDFLIVN
jgi:Ca2+-binding RTX toxin-like protein